MNARREDPSPKRGWSGLRRCPLPQGESAQQYALLLWLPRSSLRRLRQMPRSAEIHHSQRGPHPLRGAVLEADHGVHGDVGLAAVDRVDDAFVFLVDDAAAHFPRAGELAIVGVELLVEQQEAGDALCRWQSRVDGLDFLLE